MTTEVQSGYRTTLLQRLSTLRLPSLEFGVNDANYTNLHEECDGRTIVEEGIVLANLNKDEFYGTSVVLTRKGVFRHQNRPFLEYDLRGNHNDRVCSHPSLYLSEEHPEDYETYKSKIEEILSKL